MHPQQERMCVCKVLSHPQVDIVEINIISTKGISKSRSFFVICACVPRGRINVDPNFGI